MKLELIEILDNFQKNVLKPCDVLVENLVLEKEGSDYGACSFELKEWKIIFRVAKITPKKVGQFVTLWKRNSQGQIQPYDIQDEADYFIIYVYNQNRTGQFVFTKDVLLQQGILNGNKEGKLGFRVYPSWDVTYNQQAQKTQKWQLEYFLENTKKDSNKVDQVKRFLKL
ncbi:MepB protein [Leptospira noguchii str. 2006001870]|uniref:MepB protein n=1 Tax=Leptospira noguchii serovar Autumnalis str. ZUN142 TaxID=1085540 RepID=M6UU35_9LEPT|nr:MepB family protein [Leptospira noguchii]EKR73744.1 MepB protein [Leptospira noguchii str. 2006001870]EMO29584.1 MepB protein [Leptospira interrogans serovar Bataviae str. HAI135]EMO40803.1 MepB protein [Leptospira noguchii serovar Autumnalis str. ZUN142]